jgi:hypothetical protein
MIGYSYIKELRIGIFAYKRHYGFNALPEGRLGLSTTRFGQLNRGLGKPALALSS